MRQHSQHTTAQLAKGARCAGDDDAARVEWPSPDMDTFRDVAKKAVDAIASGTALESPSLAGVVDAKPSRAAEPPVVAADEPLTPTPVHASSSWSNRGSAFLDKWFGGHGESASAPSPPQSPKSQKTTGTTPNTRGRSVAAAPAWETRQVAVRWPSCRSHRDLTFHHPLLLRRWRQEGPGRVEQRHWRDQVQRQRPLRQSLQPTRLSTASWLKVRHVLCLPLLCPMVITCARVCTQRARTWAARQSRRHAESKKRGQWAATDRPPSNPPACVTLGSYTRQAQRSAARDTSPARATVAPASRSPSPGRLFCRRPPTSSLPSRLSCSVTSQVLL